MELRKSGTEPKAPLLANARELAHKYPRTFKRRGAATLSRANVGWTAKVNAAHERFWVEIVKREGAVLHGVILNDLVCSDDHGLAHGDVIIFCEDNIYALVKPLSTS